MKKYLILLWAAMVFVACEENDSTDYSTWTLDELLTTGGGIDYLVTQSTDIDYDELNERLKTEALYESKHTIYEQRGGVWWKEQTVGGGSSVSILMEDNTLRYCFEDEQTGEKGYHSRRVKGENAMVDMVEHMGNQAKIVAYAENTLVIECVGLLGYHYRYLARFSDTREKVLNTYTVCWHTYGD